MNFQPMTVADLINALNLLDPNMPVVVDQCDAWGGYTPYVDVRTEQFDGHEVVYIGEMD